MMVLRTALCFGIAFLNAASRSNGQRTERDSLTQRPVIISHPPIEYPDSLLQAGIGGRVVLELVIDERGRVVPHSVRVIHRVHPVLDSIAQAVIEHSKFRPTRVRNRSTKTLIQVPITFGSPEQADSGAGIARSNRSDSSIDKVDTHVENIESLPSKPELVFGPAPRYPVDLMRRGIKGVVLVQFILDTTGAPEAGSIQVLRGAHPEFDSEAVYIVRQSRFRPGRISDGHAVRVLIQQPIMFGVGRGP